jgi:hypothetical protein
MDTAASAAAVFIATATKSPSEDGISPTNHLVNNSYDPSDPQMEGVPTELALFFSGYRIRTEIWAIPLIVFAGLEMFLVACFEAYVVVRVVAGRAPYRNFYLNQVQLLGNFLLSSVALFYASDMNPMYCVVVRFGTGMSYALVFAAMLVKSVYYLSAQNGVYLPSSYQALLLLFTLLPQVSDQNSRFVRTAIGKSDRQFLTRPSTILSSSLESHSAKIRACHSPIFIEVKR